MTPVQRVVVAACLLSLGASAIAAPRGEQRPVVAILPFTAADASLALYSRAAATALAGELSSVEGVRVESVSLDDTLPAGVSFAIDGRIVRGQGGAAVSIELTLRDTERGVAVGTVATRSAPLAEIDVLVAEAARDLPRLIARATAEQRRRRAERDRPIRLSPTIVEGTAAERGGDGARPEQPALVVLDATGSAAGGTVAVDDIATRAARELASRLGYRPVSGGTTAVSSHRDAAALASELGAAGVLRVHVAAVDFGWHGVLTARGKVRVVLTAADGSALFDRTARTDTIVGSRGDTHAAVVRMVCDQAMDIAAPRIRRALRSVD